MAGCSQEQGNMGTSTKCTGIIREKKKKKQRKKHSCPVLKQLQEAPRRPTLSYSCTNPRRQSLSSKLCACYKCSHS